MKKYIVATCPSCSSQSAANAYCVDCGKYVPKTDSREVAEREAAVCPKCKQNVLKATYCVACAAEMNPVADVDTVVTDEKPKGDKSAQFAYCIDCTHKAQCKKKNWAVTYDTDGIICDNYTGDRELAKESLATE